MKQEITLNDLEIREMIEKKLNIKENQIFRYKFIGGVLNPQEIKVVILK